MRNLRETNSDGRKVRQTSGGEITNNLWLTDDSGSKVMH